MLKGGKSLRPKKRFHFHGTSLLRDHLLYVTSYSFFIDLQHWPDRRREQSNLWWTCYSKEIIFHAGNCYVVKIKHLFFFTWVINNRLSQRTYKYVPDYWGSSLLASWHSKTYRCMSWKTSVLGRGGADSQGEFPSNSVCSILVEIMAEKIRLLNGWSYLNRSKLFALGRYQRANLTEVL